MKKIDLFNFNFVKEENVFICSTPHFNSLNQNDIEMTNEKTKNKIRFVFQEKKDNEIIFYNDSHRLYLKFYKM